MNDRKFIIYYSITCEFVCFFFSCSQLESSCFQYTFISSICKIGTEKTKKEYLNQNNLKQNNDKYFEIYKLQYDDGNLEIMNHFVSNYSLVITTRCRVRTWSTHENRSSRCHQIWIHDIAIIFFVNFRPWFHSSAPVRMNIDCTLVSSALNDINFQ